MADETSSNTTEGASTTPPAGGQAGGGQAGGGDGGDARLLIHRHYIKDLSVENPNAPTIFTSREQPQIKVQLDVNASRLAERVFEIVLSVRVNSTIEDKTAFLVELDFAALAKVGDSIAEAEMARILAIEVPQLLFPFARNIVADVTRDAGFPPLLINPVDFVALGQQKAAAMAAAQNKAGDEQPQA